MSQTIPLICSRCGFRTRRKIKSGFPKPCPKCGGHMVMPGDADDGADALAWVIVAGIVIAFIVIFILGMNGIGV